MARKRFNKAEQQIIADAVADTHPDGGLVSWQNVTQWHRARIAHTAVIKRDGGWQYVEAHNLDRTARLSPGHTIITPGHVRAVPDAHPNVKASNGGYVVTNPVGEPMKRFTGTDAQTQAVAYAVECDPMWARLTQAVAYAFECDPMWARLAALQAEREAMVADGRAIVVDTS
jgi:hypothetical protein